jgi:threonine/homoserine/homoserine lactone efflux protein
MTTAFQVDAGGFSRARPEGWARPQGISWANRLSGFVLLGFGLGLASERRN